MLYERDVDAAVIWQMLLDDAVNFLGLPINNASHDQRQTTTGVALFQPVALVNPATFAQFNVPCQGMNLFTFEQAPAVTAA